MNTEDCSDPPLELFARCLLFSNQGQDHSRGLDQHKITDAGPAVILNNLAELILKRLPMPPAAVLDLQPHLSLGSALAGAGYAVTRVGLAATPTDSGGASQSANTSAVSHPAHLDQADYPRGERRSFVLLGETSAQPSSLNLFNRSCGLLAEDDQMIVVGEFSVDLIEQDSFASAPLLDATIAQAERCGFALHDAFDLTAAAAGANDALLNEALAAPSTPCPHLPSDAKSLRCLCRALSAYAERHATGRFVYKMVRFRRVKPPRWRIALAETYDQAAVRALFGQVFAPEQMSPDQWVWKYGGGRGLAVLAWQGGTLVAHYGGMVRPLRYFGRDVNGVQIGDVMVAKTERSVLTRSGAFYRTGATFLETWIGYGSRCLLGFGFPTVQAMKIGERLGLYAEVDRIVELRWTAHNVRSSVLTGARNLSLPKDARHIETLWQQMSVDLVDAIVAVRDSAYVERRYLEHPHKTYHLVLVTRRVTGKPLGLLVLRRSDQGSFSLLDYIGPMRHLRICIDHGRRIVACAGGPSVSAWITAGFARMFEQTEAEVHCTDVRIPTSVHSTGPSPSQLRGHWWLMGGDADFN